MISHAGQKKSIFLSFMQKKLLTPAKKIVYIVSSHVHRYCGRLAEWLCRGLQILLYRFDSGTGLHEILFRLSSAVEQSAVNRLVACSNQAAGAIKKRHLYDGVFLWLRLSERVATNGCLFGAGSWFKRACEV